MDILLGAVVALVSGWWLIIRFYKPAGKPNWQRHLVGMASGFLLFVGVIVITVPEQPEAIATVQTTTAQNDIAILDTLDKPAIEEPSKEKPVKTLDLTPDQYAKRFNAFMKELHLPYVLKPKVDNSGVFGTFSSVLSDHIAITGVVDKNSGLMTGMIMMGSGDGTMESGLNVVQMAIASLAAGTPGGTIQNVTPEVIALMEAAGTAEEGASRIFNNIKFHYSQSQITGAWFSIAPRS